MRVILFLIIILVSFDTLADQSKAVGSIPENKDEHVEEQNKGKQRDDNFNSASGPGATVNGQMQFSSKQPKIYQKPGQKNNSGGVEPDTETPPVINPSSKGFPGK